MFEAGKPAKGKNFFDRKATKKILSLLIKDHMDFMMKAPRRYGKTSLVREIMGDKQYIYIDFMKRPKLQDVVEDMINQAYEILGLNGFIKKSREAIGDLLSEKSIKGSVGLGDITLGLEIANESKETDVCKRFTETLDLIETLGKKNGFVFTIVFDEFQEIIKHECGEDILGMMRGTLQHQEYTHAIFLGSIESVMNRIFSNKESPFFNYCRLIELEPFDLKELEDEIKPVLLKKEIVFGNDEDFTKLLEKLEGHPANTMLTIQILYYSMMEKGGVSVVKQEDIDEAYESTYYDRKEASIQMVLRAKSKKNYLDVLYSTARDEESELEPSRLYQIRRGLIDMGLLIQRGRDNYLIADNFLKEYLIRE